MNAFKRIECFVFGHRYEVWQEFSRTSRRVICRHCGGDWGMNDEVRAFVPWCGQLAEIYEMQGIRIRERSPQTQKAPKGP